MSSTAAVSMVLYHSKAKPVAKLILIAIADHYGGQGTCFPSLELLRQAANLQDVRTVRKWLKYLEDIGEIERTQFCKTRAGHRVPLELDPDGRPIGQMPGRRTTNAFGILITCNPGCNGLKHVPEAENDPGPNGPVSDPTPDQTVRSHRTKQSGHTGPNGPDHYIELTNELTNELKTLDRDAIDPFEAFWSAYPRNVGKANAIKAWAKNVAKPKTDPDLVIAAAVRLRDDPNRIDRFTPHPTTWLNRHGWLDDPLPDQQAKASPFAMLAEFAAGETRLPELAT